MSEEALLSYEPLDGERHRHSGVEHRHPHSGPHSHEQRLIEMLHWPPTQSS